VSPEDFYEILGVEKTASSKDIKAAYYELSKKYHPDVGGSQGTSDAKRFHQITEAYETLGNDEKRRTYDDEQKSTNMRLYESGTGHADPDLETLREFQRKWNLRRQQFNRERAQRMRSDFDMKNDTEEFESFYKRYRDNVTKARRWDENSEANMRNFQGARREHYTDFQKEMLRKQHAKQNENVAIGYIAAFSALVGTLVLFYTGAAR